MDPPDDNYSFDFFADDPPPASQGLRGRLPQRARRGGGAPQGPPRQLAPLLRLLALVFVLILVVLVFALLVNSCAGESRHDAYAGYMEQVNSIALASSADGVHAVSALTTQGLTVPQMVSKLRSLAAAEQQNVQAARSLAAPGRLRGENADLIEALQLRVLGLDGLAGAFQQTIGAKTPASVEALALSRQAYRLLASDILWDDLFLKPAATQLSRDGVGGVNVPDSHFLGTDPNLIVTPKAMSLVVRRIVVGAGKPRQGHACGPARHEPGLGRSARFRRARAGRRSCSASEASTPSPRARASSSASRSTTEGTSRRYTSRSSSRSAGPRPRAARSRRPRTWS